MGGGGGCEANPRERGRTGPATGGEVNLFRNLWEKGKELNQNAMKKEFSKATSRKFDC